MRARSSAGTSRIKISGTHPWYQGISLPQATANKGDRRHDKGSVNVSAGAPPQNALAAPSLRDKEHSALSVPTTGYDTLLPRAGGRLRWQSRSRMRLTNDGSDDAELHPPLGHKVVILKMYRKDPPTFYCKACGCWYPTGPGGGSD